MATAADSWEPHRQVELRGLHYRALTASARILQSAIRGFLDHNDLLRASALTYTVALSIVPIMALAFSVLKGFGGVEQLTPMIEHNFKFAGIDQLMAYVNRTNAAALGSAGGALLLITVISTMSTIERAFNTIWRVPRERSYLRKFSDYLSVLFTVPLLMAGALTLTAIFTVRISAMPLVTTYSPYLMSWIAFFFLFVFFPYTHVHYGAAAVGSLVSAVLFQIAQWAFVRFQIGAANYHAIYGALATVPLFLVWTYTAWAIILFGAEVSAAVQRGVREMFPAPDSPRFGHFAALHTLLRLGERHLHGGAPVTLYSLSGDLRVDESALEPIVEGLKTAGFVIEAGGEPDEANSGLFLALAPGAISLKAAMAALPREDELQGDPRIAGLINRLERAQDELLGSLTLADLMAPARAGDLASAPVGELAAASDPGAGGEPAAPAQVAGSRPK